jgi:hypothetical protein
MGMGYPRPLKIGERAGGGRIYRTSNLTPNEAAELLKLGGMNLDGPKWQEIYRDSLKAHHRHLKEERKKQYPK